MQTIHIAGRDLELLVPSGFSPGTSSCPVVYALDSDIIFKALEKIQGEKKSYRFLLVGIPPLDRLSEYTPWPAKALHERFADFGGKGGEFLDYLGKVLIPGVNKKLFGNAFPSQTALLGHSLSGLLGIYSLYKTDIFDDVVSISGSFWYPDWTGFVKKNSLINKKASVFLSSGEDEGKGAHDIKRNAAQATKDTYEALINHLPQCNIEMQWNPYGHHENIPLKLSGALTYLDKQFQ
ncbi:alpha/beta hydrolase-fold protein [Lacrimispora sp. BS-2]|uniref:Alpha/beta hydrolase-fold protein n=1 Tax=Lacrimispora sp. BS-2 TaxID=3151850 RepID=A0AAU7PN54_9FIRM